MLVSIQNACFNNSTAEETAPDMPASMVIGSGLDQASSTTSNTTTSTTTTVAKAAANQILLPAPPTGSTSDVYRRIQGGNVLVATDSPASRNLGVFKGAVEDETLVKDTDQNQNEKSDLVSFPFQNQSQGGKSDLVSFPFQNSDRNGRSELPFQRFSGGGDLNSSLVPVSESRNQNGVFFGGGWIPTNHAPRSAEGVSYSQECTEVSSGAWFSYLRKQKY